MCNFLRRKEIIAMLGLEELAESDQAACNVMGTACYVGAGLDKDTAFYQAT